MDIRTDRLTIRKFLDDDREEVFGYISNATIKYYMPEGVISIVEITKNYLDAVD